MMISLKLICNPNPISLQVIWNPNPGHFKRNLSLTIRMVENFGAFKVIRDKKHSKFESLLLSCVLLELLRSLRLPTFLIAFVLPIAQALLISFHDAVNSFLPLPSLHPAMPPLFPLFLRLSVFLVDLDCVSQPSIFFCL